MMSSSVNITYQPNINYIEDIIASVFQGQVSGLFMYQQVDKDLPNEDFAKDSCRDTIDKLFCVRQLFHVR